MLCLHGRAAKRRRGALFDIRIGSTPEPMLAVGREGWDRKKTRRLSTEEIGFVPQIFFDVIDK
jgi:hypothetical protein